eukprot:757123-Hanusia_phi.AAC.2
MAIDLHSALSEVKLCMVRCLLPEWMSDHSTFPTMIEKVRASARLTHCSNLIRNECIKGC